MFELPPQILSNGYPPQNTTSLSPVPLTSKSQRTLHEKKIVEVILPVANPPLQQVQLETSQLFSLRGRLIAVTGGGRGLGIAAIRSILESGGDAACIDILPKPSGADWNYISRIARERGASLSYHQVDVTDAAALEQVFQTIIQSSRNPLRGVVACAAITQTFAAVDYPVAEFRRVLDINTTGAFLTAQMASRSFIAQSVAGSIVMVASMSGSIANKGLSCVAYNASKSAVHQICRSMAAELSAHPEHPIRINTLSPGYIRTAMTDQLLESNAEMEAGWVEESMLHRLAEPDEFRGPIVFLLGDASSFMTGADLRIDGGHTAW